MTLPVDGFREAIRSAGIDPPAEIIADGNLHRFHIEGDKPRSVNGWYVLHFDDPPAGAFGCWKRGINETWCAAGDVSSSPEQKAALKKRFDELRRLRDQEKEQRHAEAQRKAKKIYDKARPANTDHPYLKFKCVQPLPGIKVFNGSLVVPVRDKDLQLHGLQFINVNGEKVFLSGTNKKGHYCGAGLPNGVIFIVEGVATAASIREATGQAVAIAFDAGNLKPVAQTLRDKLPEIKLIICADNDPSGVGQANAAEAAQAVDGVVIVPKFLEGTEGATDFNDLHQLEGLEAVQKQIDAVLTGVPKRKSSPIKKVISVDGWPPPGVLEAELLPVPPIDAEVLLPDPLRRWITDEAERMPTSIEFVAAPALAALGSVIGTQCAIRPKRNDSWIVVANVWGAVVGLPSAKKSPAIAAGLKPLDFLNELASKCLSLETQQFETQLLVHQAKQDAIQSRIKAAAKNSEKGDPDEIAQELLALKQSCLNPPAKRRRKTNDTTVEKLGEILQANPKGLLIIRDELTGLLATMDKAGHEGDRAFYLEAWSGLSAYDTDRIGRGSIHIANLCLAIFGGIQPDKLLAYLEHAANSFGNDGLLQRLQLLVYPDHHPWTWRDRKPDKAAQAAAFKIFEVLDDFDPVQWGASPADERNKYPHFCFSEEAQEIFKEWATELHGEKLPNESHPLIAQHLAKYDKLFPALALIFHLVDCASGNPGPNVSAESALRAAAWCEFLEAHARRCYGLLVDDGQRAALTLAGHLRKGKIKDLFTIRDVRRNQWSHLTTNESIQAALEWLEDENFVRPETIGSGPKGGRPTTAYRINPALLKTENQSHDDVD